MQYVHEYLQLSGHTSARDRAAFVAELRCLWFDLYKRKVRNDSSGFEHVFLGEVKVRTEMVELSYCFQFSRTLS